jgi:hypothetical protein
VPANGSVRGNGANDGIVSTDPADGGIRSVMLVNAETGGESCCLRSCWRLTNMSAACVGVGWCCLQVMLMGGVAVLLHHPPSDMLDTLALQQYCFQTGCDACMLVNMVNHIRLDSVATRWCCT